MPDTIRQRIFDKMAVKLLAITDVARVYRAREAVDLGAIDYPSVKLVDRGDSSTTRRLQCWDRRLAFDIVIFTKEVDKAERDDILETLLGQVEAELIDEDWDDLAYETLLQSTDEAQSDAAPEQGRRTMTGEVGYRTALGDSTKVVVL